MSSLVFLGLSIIVFVIVYGIAFLLVPMILGAFFSTLNVNGVITDTGWLATYNKEQSILQFLIPLIPTIGIFLLIIKALMAASVKGAD